MFFIRPRSSHIINFTEGFHIWELSVPDISGTAACPGFIDSHFQESAEMHMDQEQEGTLVFAIPTPSSPTPCERFR